MPNKNGATAPQNNPAQGNGQKQFTEKELAELLSFPHSEEIDKDWASDDSLAIAGLIFGFGDSKQSKGQTRSTTVKAETGRKRGKSRDTLERMAWVLQKQKEYASEGIYSVTVRQMFYAATVDGVVEKQETGYGKIQRVLADMRRSGELPYSFIADNVRWVRVPRLYRNASHAVQSTSETYRRNYWQGQESCPQIWLEKEALAGVFQEVTDGYGVPLYVSKGFCSITFLHDSLKGLGEGDQLFLFYDFDASGQCIAQTLANEANERGAIVELVGVTPKQIKEWSLPERPSKQTDTRARSFQESFGDVGSVELDAIPPKKLWALLKEKIDSCIDDPDDWENQKALEQKDIEDLERWASQRETT